MLLRQGLARVAIALSSLFTPSLSAHTLPLSQVELRTAEHGFDVTVEAPAIDFAHDLPEATPELLMTSAGADANREKLVAILATRLIFEADGETLKTALLEIEPLAERKMVRVRLHAAWSQPPRHMTVNCRLFPYDPRHKTFLDIYQNDELQAQFIFDEKATRFAYVPAAPQSRLAVVRQFLFEGVHHIFIGPDHILFIIGLLLLGGTLTQLLKIITAFTLAHSVTLVLATFDVLTPPTRVIEPAIALSIVFVGAQALLQAKGTRDWRLLFAFCFGLVHGFGFANVLRELDLPRAALGWSLASFNVGVEIGQACIVLVVAPLLALVHRRSAAVAANVVTASSYGVIGVGAFWFAQRVLPVS